MNKRELKLFVLGRPYQREQMLRYVILSVACFGLVYERSIHFSDLIIPSIESILFVALSLLVGVYVLFCHRVNSRLIEELSKKNQKLHELEDHLEHLKTVYELNPQEVSQRFTKSQIELIRKSIDELIKEKNNKVSRSKLALISFINLKKILGQKLPAFLYEYLTRSKKKESETLVKNKK